MPGAAVRFAAGFVVGCAVGFVASNAFDAARRVQRPSEPVSTTEDAAATSRLDDELSDEEIQRAMAAVDARPDDYDAQFKMGEVLLRLAGRPRDAIRYYRRASELKPKSAEPLAGVGDASLAAAVESKDGADRELLDDATRAYERGATLEPRNAGIRAALGVARSLGEPGNPKRAIAEFRAALAIDPQNEMALQGLAVTLAQSGDTAAATDALNRLDRAHPDSEGVARARAAIEASSAPGAERNQTRRP